MFSKHLQFNLRDFSKEIRPVNRQKRIDKQFLN